MPLDPEKYKKLALNPDKYRAMATPKAELPKKKERPFFEFLPETSAEEVYGKGAKEPDRGILRYNGGDIGGMFDDVRNWATNKIGMSNIKAAPGWGGDPKADLGMLASLATEVPRNIVEAVNDPLVAAGGIYRKFVKPSVVPPKPVIGGAEVQNARVNPQTGETIIPGHPKVELGKHGGAAYEEKLMAQAKDEVDKTRKLEFTDPDMPPNERLRKFAEQDKGDVIDTTTGEVVNVNSGNIPNVRKTQRIRKNDPTEGKKILNQIVGEEPPKVQFQNDKPLVSYQAADEQLGMGFGNDAPPKDFSWGDWWSGTSRAKKLSDITGAAKSVQSSFDISWPLRQGRKIMHTKAWRDGVKEGIKALKTEGNYEEAMRAIKSDPEFLAAEQAGVDFTDIASKRLAKREEPFNSPLAENIPFFGRFIHASGRSYTVMGNKARLEFFKAVTKDPNVDKVAAAEMVNTLTGRPTLPTKDLERAAPALNRFLYSPKSLYSNIKVLNPYTYIKAPKGVRKQYVYSALQMMGTTYAVNNIAEAMGAKVTWDPTSSDFGKIVIGNTHFDPMGGMQQPLVLAARLATGKKTSTAGKTSKLGEGFGSDSAASVIGDFVRSKLDPIPGAIINTLGGEDPVGNPTNAGKELLKLYTPLITQDLYEVAQENPALMPIVAALTGIGVGQATYGPRKNKGSLFSPPKVPSLPNFPKAPTF